MKQIDAQQALADTRPPKTPFGSRYVDFLRAGLDNVTMLAVIFNIVSHQQSESMLKTDRPVPLKREKMPERYRRNREHLIMLNDSDEKVLKQLGIYRSENSLDMDETALQWFEYITTGQIGAAVAEVI